MNRREFISDLSQKAGVATMAAATLNLSAQSGGSQRKLGIALVGLGGLSTNQIAPALQKTKNCKLVGIVTGTPSKEKMWAAKYGIQSKNIYNYGNFDAVQNNPDIDVVYIVLPNGMHPEYVIRGAQAGKHVLCEKPMANSVKDCAEMIAACRDAGRKLAVGYRCQFEPHNQECMRLSQEQPFGKINFIDAGFGFRIGNPNQWRLKHDLAGGGALMDVGIYALQACRFLTGHEPISVSATETKNDPVKFREVDETIAWAMKFPGGTMAQCNTTYAFSGINRFRAHSPKGWFGLNPAYSYSGIKGLRSDGQKIDFPQIDQFAAEMDDFADCILNNRESRVSGVEGLKDLKVIEAIYESIRRGEEVSVS
jgi:predicted dehydrogenase